STRSESRASQPGPGRAQCSVGSIEDEGIRYGFTTHCLIASTVAIAPAIVTTQSIAIRQGRGRRCVSRSIGLRDRLRGRSLIGFSTGGYAGGVRYSSGRGLVYSGGVGSGRSSGGGGESPPYGASLTTLSSVGSVLSATRRSSCDPLRAALQAPASLGTLTGACSEGTRDRRRARRRSSPRARTPRCRARRE